MQILSLALDINSQRPIIALANGYSAMIDTGALLPVWYGNTDTLIKDFNAILWKRNVVLNGIGGSCICNVYKIDLNLKSLKFENLPVAVIENVSASFDLLLSATMFTRVIYTVDMPAHQFRITIPDGESLRQRLTITDQGGVAHVFAQAISELESHVFG